MFSLVIYGAFVAFDLLPSAVIPLRCAFKAKGDDKLFFKKLFSQSTIVAFVLTFLGGLVLAVGVSALPFPAKAIGLLAKMTGIFLCCAVPATFVIFASAGIIIVDAEKNSKYNNKKYDSKIISITKKTNLIVSLLF